MPGKILVHGIGTFTVSQHSAASVRHRHFGLSIRKGQKSRYTTRKRGILDTKIFNQPIFGLESPDFFLSEMVGRFSNSLLNDRLQNLKIPVRR
jgi:hypothetical protein